MMANNLIETLKDLIKTGESLAPRGGEMFHGYNEKEQPEYQSWRLQTMTILNELGKSATPLLKELENDKFGPYFYERSAKNILGVLKAGLAIAERQEKSEMQTIPQLKKQEKKSKKLNSVFIVHGHDKTLLEQTARFLEKLDIEPIILFEKPGKGQTIIEKLEEHCDVSFSLVLLTPDDVGKAASEKDLHPRARQNVVLELGYFLGYLGRHNVAVLYDESVELPSDYRGVDYIKIDPSGAWKLKLAKELKEAGLDIDMNKVI